MNTTYRSSIMKTKLIVIAGILCLPLSVAFADMKNSTTEPTNTDGTTTSEPMGKNNNPSTGTDRHDKSNINRSNDNTRHLEQKGTQKMPNDVPLKTTPNDVPVKQPSDLNTHPSTTY